jgi:ferredoxin
MANKNDDRVGRGVPGRFYVDSKCIDCDLCRDIAPEFFARDDDGYSKVIKQPDSDGEIDTCVEAMDSCPVGAIGDDGE